jgi:hypothetical protein
MWEQYKKSLWGMQLVMALVSAVLYLRVYRAWQPTLVFYAVLQISSVLGVYWGLRLRQRKGFRGRV